MDKEKRIESLERALKATRLVLEEVPDGSRNEATMNPSGNKKPRRALKFVLSVLKTNFRPRDSLDLIGDLKEATHEIFDCQQNNERAFKLVWYDYVVSQQRASHTSDLNSQGKADNPLRWPLWNLLYTFSIYPFAVSPERMRRAADHIYAIINHNREATTGHEALARQLGEAWVDNHFLGYAGEIQGIGALQTSLFELLWSGTVEQLKRDSPYSSDHPERPEFERTAEKLERVLQEAIVRSKRQQFSIAFCGMVKPGKLGRSILPSDGESYDSRMLHHTLSITAELPSAVLPCRFRHVEGLRVPKLQFQAYQFLVALDRFRDLRYGQKMQTYRPSPENIFEAPLSDAPRDRSKALPLRTIHKRLDGLHAATLVNLLKFESPGFHLPRIATGDVDVKVLVSFVSC